MNDNSSPHSAKEKYCLLLVDTNKSLIHMVELLEILCKNPRPESKIDLTKQIERFTQLQKRIEDCTQKLESLALHIGTPDSHICKLLNERMELFEKVLHRNKSAVKTATSIKALIGSEISKFKSGRRALQGYQSNELSNNSKNIVNTSF